MTPPSIYLRFADRNEQIFAVCERHAAQLETAMADAAKGIGPVADDLRCAIEQALIRPQDPLSGAELGWMVIHGAVSLLISKPDFPWHPVDEISDQPYDTMRAGLRAP